MKPTGHGTASLYSRYAIVSEADLRAGVAKVVARDTRTDRKVLTFPTRRAADG